MMKYKIRYTQDAVDALDTIFDYVAIENREAALRMLQRFRRRIERLSTTPYMGAAVPVKNPNYSTDGYRYMSVPPYLVFYRVEAKEVRIANIFHSRQNWLHLLFQSGKARPSSAERLMEVGLDEDE